MIRFLQVIKFGWKHSAQMASQTSNNMLRRCGIFVDMLYSFFVYKMWTNQYLKENFYNLNDDERQKLGGRYKEIGQKRDAWQKDFRQNRRFLIKYSDIKYEKASLRNKRNKAYMERFNTGESLMVENDVNISRQHYLNGSINIGKNVLLAKHVFIDYSGNVTIGDNVQLANGVIIESHSHPFHSDYKQSRSIVEQSSITIGEGVVIGSRAIIMPTCHSIGKFARIGAGAVVTKDIPDYAVAVGVPAKIVRVQESN